MLNQIVLVGRLTSNPEVKELEEGKKYCNITIACPRSFKNTNGEYETDFIECKLWDSIARNTAEYCRKGDVIGVKGRLQTTKVDDKNIQEVIAEKVTFLSSKKEGESEE